ncbi:MAG: DUF4387 family protein [Boseongicola sp.]|nr:MAG: DUF4387 family protein [Boseongicola sp.]
MPDICDIAQKARAKIADPFWETVDNFCEDAEANKCNSSGLEASVLDRAFDTTQQTLNRANIACLNVIKRPIQRPAVQGTSADFDSHETVWPQVAVELSVYRAL